MIDLSEIHTQYPDVPSNLSLTSDGSQLFPYLWRYFLSHQHVRDWLMRAPPYTSASLHPDHIANGTAFCCNFDVPPLWADMATAFDLGEIFVPDHAHAHFMCGSVVAATSLHKHLVCALGGAAMRDPASQRSFRTAARRMVVDMGSSHAINIIEFSWMTDGALIVTVKVLVPPDPCAPLRSAGCTGAFALFTGVAPAGPTPLAPRSLVSFVEVPRCPSCMQAGSLGCYCRHPHTDVMQKSSALFPPRLARDLSASAVETYHNVRVRLDLIQHIAHVKITAHMVEHIDACVEPPSVPGRRGVTYRLGQSRFVVRPVLFRPADRVECDTLRQIAHKLRLLRCGALRIAHARVGDGDKRGESELQTVGRQEESSVSSVATSFSRCGSRSVSRCTDDNGSARYGSDGETRNVVVPPSELIFSSYAGGGRLRCPRCDKSFSQQGSLNRHLKNIHDQRKIPCDYCSMTFGQMFDLKRHQRRKHADKQATNIRRERIDAGRIMRVQVGRV